MGHYHYPELPEDGIRVTYDRDTALAMEDVGFFSWENPVVQQAMDLAITDTKGNSTMIAVKHPQIKAGGLLVEVLHVVDCVAPAELMADRYMPSSIIRALITPTLDDVSETIRYQPFTNELLDVPKETLCQILDSQADGIKAMTDKARQFARDELEELKKRALSEMNRSLHQEIGRLTELQKLNSSIRADELDHLHLALESLTDAITNSDVRMDAIRIIVAT
jgi:ATP-dependent helicase HepA